MRKGFSFVHVGSDKLLLWKYPKSWAFLFSLLYFAEANFRLCEQERGMRKEGTMEGNARAYKEGDEWCGM